MARTRYLPAGFPRVLPHAPPPVCLVFRGVVFFFENGTRTDRLRPQVTVQTAASNLGKVTAAIIFTENVFFTGLQRRRSAFTRKPEGRRRALSDELSRFTEALLLPRLKLQSVAARAFSTPESFPAREFDSRDYGLLLFNKDLIRRCVYKLRWHVKPIKMYRVALK